MSTALPIARGGGALKSNRKEEEKEGTWRARIVLYSSVAMVSSRTQHQQEFPQIANSRQEHSKAILHTFPSPFDTHLGDQLNGARVSLMMAWNSETRKTERRGKAGTITGGDSF